MVEQELEFDPSSEHVFLVVVKDKLLQPASKPGLLLGRWQDLEFLHAYHEEVVKVGEYQGKQCYLVDIGHEAIADEAYESVSLRALVMQMDMDFFGVAARAWQLALFLRTHRYCGQCGSQMQHVGWEMAMECARCGHRCYPRISPCIIVAIRKGKQILLAHGRHHKQSMYSTLAGFVESGETLEQAVHREVMEEVGISIKNVRYFSSQPWPFPHSLMCGFFADYASGDIVVDAKEIVDAKWFDIDNLPFIPPTFSIAGQLIEKTVKDIEQSISAQGN